MLKLNQEASITLLRITLGIIFIWFGLLKLFDTSPVKEIIFKAMPQFLTDIGPFMLSVALMEILLGMGLLFKKTAKITALILILHLTISTLSVLITQGFYPSFPFLTLEGEFVIKNLSLIAGATVIYSSKS